MEVRAGERWLLAMMGLEEEEEEEHLQHSKSSLIGRRAQVTLQLEAPAAAKCACTFLAAAGDSRTEQ